MMKSVFVFYSVIESLVFHSKAKREVFIIREILVNNYPDACDKDHVVLILCRY